MSDSEYRTIPLHARDGSIRAYTQVDDEDFERFGSLRWSLIQGGYVYRTYKVEGKQYGVYLHREVLGLSPGDGLFADHINRDRLDNRRSNLRVATPSENAQNLSHQAGGVSRYRGVSRNRNRWSATVVSKGKHHHVGLFGTELDAGAAAAQWRAKHFPNAVEDPELLAHQVVRDKPRSFRAGLTDGQVFSIRICFLEGNTVTQTGRATGVSSNVVSNVIRGKSYGDLPLAEEARAEWLRRKRNRTLDSQSPNSR